MPDLNDFSMQTVICNNTILHYIIAFIILIVGFIVAAALKRVINVITNKIADKTRYPFLAYLLCSDRVLLPILNYLPLYFATQYLVLPLRVTEIVAYIGIAIITISVVRYLNLVMDWLLDEYAKRPGVNPIVGQSLSSLLNILLWIGAVLFILSNFGVNITTLIAGLGIGGAAIALASQTILTDLFNYFTIIFDRPFTVGDSVQVNSTSGTIKTIGLKGTRLISANGEEIVVPNTDMTKNALRNYQIMDQRRVILKLRVRYDTPVDKLKQVPDVIKGIIEGVKDTKFERAHFAEIGDSSLVFEISYTIPDNDFNLYMDRMQEINYKVMDAFEGLGIRFALPSQSVYVEQASPIT